MGSLTDRLELECQISKLQSTVLVCGSQLRRANDDCAKVTDKIIHAKARLQHQINNRNHIRLVADHISLEEFSAIAQSIRHLTIELDSLQFESAIFHKNKTTIARQIAESEAAIERKRAFLKDYGRVLKFPSK